MCVCVYWLISVHSREKINRLGATRYGYGVYARIRIVPIHIRIIIDDDNRRLGGGGDDDYDRSVFSFKNYFSIEFFFFSLIKHAVSFFPSIRTKPVYRNYVIFATRAQLGYRSIFLCVRRSTVFVVIVVIFHYHSFIYTHTYVYLL